jgi:hypothetical protein
MDDLSAMLFGAGGDALAAVMEPDPEKRQAKIEAVAHAESERERKSGQTWIKGWLDPYPEHIAQEWIHNARSLSLEEQELRVRFPISCLVRAKDGCSPTIPEPGLLAIVFGHNAGKLLLKTSEHGVLALHVDPSMVEVVHFVEPLTTTWVRDQLAREEHGSIRATGE